MSVSAFVLFTSRCALVCWPFYLLPVVGLPRPSGLMMNFGWATPSCWGWATTQPLFPSSSADRARSIMVKAEGS